MHVVVILIIAVIAVIILVRMEVPSKIVTVMIPFIFGTLGGGATAAAASFIATPFVGIPVGLIVGVWLFLKLMKS